MSAECKSNSGSGSAPESPVTRTCSHCGITAPTSTFEPERRKLGYVCKDGFECVERAHQNRGLRPRSSRVLQEGEGS